MNIFISLYPEVSNAVSQGVYKSGFEHYERYGANEGRWGNVTLEYNEVSYLAANPDVAAAVRAGIFTSGYQHYISLGYTEGRLSSPYGYFSTTYYLAENPDIPTTAQWPDYKKYSTDSELANHFLTIGAFKGLSPSANVFNEFGYLAKNPDVAAAVFSGALPSGRAHYDAWGKSEGRDASGRLFDEADYLQRYPDVVGGIQRGRFASGEEHYSIFGKTEGRVVKYFGRSIDASVAKSDFQLVGGAGDDTLTGGSGNDTILAHDGNNLLSGNAGNDSISAGNGNVTISGGDGDDTITSGNGFKVISGGSGNDSITSGNGGGTIDGGSGNDFITSGYGNDIISSGDGDDTIRGSSGNNTLTGGQGADRFVYSLGEVYNFSDGNKGINDIITDFQVGIDKIDVSRVFTVETVTTSTVFATRMDIVRDGTHVMATKTTVMGGPIDFDMNVTYGVNSGVPEAVIKFTYGHFLKQASSNLVIYSGYSTITLPGVTSLAESDFIFS